MKKMKKTLYKLSEQQKALAVGDKVRTVEGQGTIQKISPSGMYVLVLYAKSKQCYFHSSQVQKQDEAKN